MWLSIEYRDFYDVPRTFIVEWESRLFLFDCPFDQTADEYPDTYKIYALPDRPDGDSWEELAGSGECMGEVPVRSVVFDATKRRAIDGAALESL